MDRGKPVSQFGSSETVPHLVSLCVLKFQSQRGEENGYDNSYQEPGPRNLDLGSLRFRDDQLVLSWSNGQDDVD